MKSSQTYNIKAKSNLYYIYYTRYFNEIRHMVSFSFVFISYWIKGFFFFSLPSGHNKLENPDLMLKTHIFPFIPCLFQRSRQPFDNCLESRNASNLLNLKSHFTAQLTAAKSQTTLQYFLKIFLYTKWNLQSKFIDAWVNVDEENAGILTFKSEHRC